MKSIAKSLGIQGWSLLRDAEDKLYLSKFDPTDKRNDDEYRVYFFIRKDGIQIVRRFVMWNSKYKENIETDNKFYKEAELILYTYYREFSHNHQHQKVS